MKPTELEAAVELLWHKSEGAFVYVARMLERLDAKETCTLKDIENFPNGLYGEYVDFFGRVCCAGCQLDGFSRLVCKHFNLLS